MGVCEQQCGKVTNLVRCGPDKSWELLSREVEPQQSGKEEPWDSGF